MPMSPISRRSAPHPDSACHILVLEPLPASFGPDLARVSLVHYEYPRREGEILSTVESPPVTTIGARSLYDRARLAALPDVPKVLLSACHRPKKVASPGSTTKLTNVSLTHEGMSALSWLIVWMKENEADRPGRNGALDLAVKEAARNRGWSPPGPIPNE